MRDSGADAGASPVNDAPTDPASAPAPESAGSQRAEDRAAREPKHRHRALVWSLVVLASVVLLVSMIANWVQTEVLDSNQFANSTEEILQNKDVQEQLSIFAVDQLYANVDVQAQIEQKLPPPAQPLAAPVTAATRQLATNVAETALASPQVQDLVCHRDQWGAAAVRQPDREQGPVRLDRRRRRHPRIRELRRRPCHPPGSRSLDDLPDPGPHSAVLDGAEAALDHGPDPDRVNASSPLPGAGGHAEPAGATEPPGPSKRMPPRSRRRSRASSRRSRAFSRRPPPSSRAGCPTSRAVWPSSTNG